MKRFKLSRKEKLLYATPLLLPLLVLAWSVVWPLVSADSFERTLQELAGPQAIDCGTSSSVLFDPCAVAAYKANQPFIVRMKPPHPGSAIQTLAQAMGLVRTPQGEVYSVSYYSRRHWTEKGSV